MKKLAGILLVLLLLMTGCSLRDASAPDPPEDASPAVSTEQESPLSDDEKEASSNQEESREGKEESAPDKGKASGNDLSIDTDYTIREKSFENEAGEEICGDLYVPEEKNGLTVIFSHGLGGSRSDLSDYADMLASRGCMIYTFDFRGGGYNSESDGSVSGMSVLTEEEDLEDAYDMVSGLRGVDEERIYLLGMSQGGMVSALYAGDHPEDPAGLLLLYPAFVIPDFVDGKYRGNDMMQRLFNYYSAPGNRYAEDAAGMDVDEEIAGYSGPVLLMHGTEDVIVPYTYSVEASEVYEDADLKLYEGADHGFSDPADRRQSMRDIRSFLTEH